LKYTIGTRGSKLSLAQTDWVVKKLEKLNPDASYDVKKISTSGDTDVRPLFMIDQKGIFEKEIDRAVIDGEVDFAVHSMKDVPSRMPDELVLACIPLREAANDVFISKDGSTLDGIKSGALIGTSSLRRAVQVKRKRQDVDVKPVRGNIETRIKKVTDTGEYDAIVLAQAGITRMGLEVNYSALSTDDFSPSPGQGALAVVCRSDNKEMTSMLKKIEHFTSRISIEAERSFSTYVDSGCRFPVGAYARVDDDKLTMDVVAFSVDGNESIQVSRAGSKDDPVSLGRSIGEELRNRGVGKLALNWRQKVEEWNVK